MPALISVWYLASWLTKKLQIISGGVLTPKTPPSYGLVRLYRLVTPCICALILFKIPGGRRCINFIIPRQHTDARY